MVYWSAHWASDSSEPGSIPGSAKFLSVEPAVMQYCVATDTYRNKQLKRQFE